MRTVIVASFGLLLLMLFIQYRVTVHKHIAMRVNDEDTADHTEKQRLIFRAKFMVHATQTCTSYVLYVWGVMFTKAFQGVHCVTVGENLLLSLDLNMVCYTQNCMLSHSLCKHFLDRKIDM